MTKSNGLDLHSITALAHPSEVSMARSPKHTPLPRLDLAQPMERPCGPLQMRW